MKQALFLFTLVVAMVPVGAVAAELHVGETVFLDANDYLTENVYVAGGQVTVSSTVTRDAALAGGRVIVNGPVSGDVLAVGGTVDVLERVVGDVRVLGGQVTISSQVQGDVIALGGVVHLLPGSSVSGDIMVLGGQIISEGTINGESRLYGGDVIVNGLLAGSVSIRAGNAVSFGDSAIVGDSLMYRAPEEATIAEGAELGDEVTFKPLDIPARSLGPSGATALLVAAAGVIVAIKLVTALASAIALVLLFPSFSLDVVQSSYASFWKSVGIGFAVLILTPAAIVVLALTLLGLTAASLIGLIYATLLVIAGLYGAILAGSLVRKFVRKEYGVSWVTAAVGTIVLFVASLVPIIGWAVSFVFMLAALGTVSRLLYTQLSKGT